QSLLYLRKSITEIPNALLSLDTLQLGLDVLDGASDTGIAFRCTLDDGNIRFEIRHPRFVRSRDQPTSHSHDSRSDHGGYKRAPLQGVTGDLLGPLRDIDKIG